MLFFSVVVVVVVVIHVGNDLKHGLYCSIRLCRMLSLFPLPIRKKPKSFHSSMFRSIYILCVHASSSSCCCYSLPFSYFFSSRPTPVRRKNLSTEWHKSYEHKYTIILFGEWKCFDVFIKLLHLHGLLSLYSLHTRRAIVQVEEGTRRQQSQQQQPAIEIVRNPKPSCIIYTNV